jgi:hypothetical protein
MRAVRVFAALLASALPQLGAPAVLYKSVAPNGTIMFSDTPPPSDARILEQRTVLDPVLARASGPAAAPAEQSVDFEAAVARANERIDLAEHALALARRGVWSTRDGLRIDPSRMSRSDEERVEFYKKNVLVARQGLMELLRERMVASR